MKIFSEINRLLSLRTQINPPETINKIRLDTGSDFRSEKPTLFDLDYISGETGGQSAIATDGYNSQKAEMLNQMKKMYSECPDSFSPISTDDVHTREGSWLTVVSGRRPVGQFSVDSTYSPEYRALLDLPNIGCKIFRKENSESSYEVVVYRKDYAQGEELANRLVELAEIKRDFINANGDVSPESREIEWELAVAKEIGEIFHYHENEINEYINEKKLQASRFSAPSIQATRKNNGQQALAINSFSDHIGEEFGEFDRLIKFPKEFLASSGNALSMSGNIQEVSPINEEKSAGKRISITCKGEFTPGFSPTHQSEQISDDGISSAFAADISRNDYIYSISRADFSIKLDSSDYSQPFTPQALGIISSIAHQGHLADVTGKLFEMIPDNSENLFMPKRGSRPEHRIINNGDVYEIVSSAKFELRNLTNGKYVDDGGFFATIEQTTFLDAKNFDGGNRVLAYRPKDAPSVWKISFSMMLPEGKGRAQTHPAI